MDSMIYNKVLHTPTHTGTPGEPLANRPQESAGSDSAFKELLEQKIREESQVSFLKHVIERVVERGVDVSSEKIGCFNEGIRMAEERGLKKPLILLGSTASVVNVENNKVVTAVNEDSLKGTVFTNTDGTVMIQPIPSEAILIPNDGRIGRLRKEN